nr:hypothetical protein MACL_00000171 [Theileria orientalis]
MYELDLDLIGYKFGNEGYDA